MIDRFRWLLPPVALAFLWFLLWWGLQDEHDVGYALMLAGAWLIVGVPLAYVRARRARVRG